MSLARAIYGDPRRPTEIKKYNRPVVNVENQPPEPMLLVGLVFGMAALLLKVRIAAWMSLLSCISALANMKNENMDFKQVVSAITFAVMGLVASYLVPTAERADKS